MATTPVTPTPKPDDKAATQPKVADPQPKARMADTKAAPQYPTLAKDAAWPLFYNGHRIAKKGDEPTKWLAMSRAADGVAVVQSPITKEVEDEIKAGEYYLADAVALAVPPPAAPTEPTEPPPAPEQHS